MTAPFASAPILTPSEPKRDRTRLNATARALVPFSTTLSSLEDLPRREGAAPSPPPSGAVGEGVAAGEARPSHTARTVAVPSSPPAAGREGDARPPFPSPNCPREKGRPLGPGLVGKSIAPRPAFGERARAVRQGPCPAQRVTRRSPLHHGPSPPSRAARRSGVGEGRLCQGRPRLQRRPSHRSARSTACPAASCPARRPVL